MLGLGLEARLGACGSAWSSAAQFGLGLELGGWTWGLCLGLVGASPGARGLGLGLGLGSAGGSAWRFLDCVFGFCSFAFVFCAFGFCSFGWCFWIVLLDYAFELCFWILLCSPTLCFLILLFRIVFLDFALLDFVLLDCDSGLCFWILCFWIVLLDFALLQCAFGLCFWIVPLDYDFGLCFWTVPLDCAFGFCAFGLCFWILLDSLDSLDPFGFFWTRQEAFGLSGFLRAPRGSSGCLRGSSELLVVFWSSEWFLGSS